MKSNKGLKILIYICVGMISVGVLFSGIGFLMGGGKFIGDLYGGRGIFIGEKVTENVELQAFTKVKIYAGVSDINFVESDKFAVEYCYDSAIGEPDLKMEGDTLVYKDKLYGEVKEKNFGLHQLVKTSNNPKIYVTIYCPKDTTFDNVEIINYIGNLNLEDFDADRIDVEANMGKINLQRINGKIMNIDADLGDIEIEDSLSSEAEITADMGDINISGELRGKTVISCDLGNVELSSSLSKDAYNYDIDVDLGDVSIDSRTTRNTYIVNNGAENSLFIQCNMGDVDLSFADI